MANYLLTQTGEEVQDILNQAPETEAGLQQEVTNREQAITAEQQAREQAIAAEATAREQAIAAEATAREQAITAEATVRADADAALDAKIDAETTRAEGAESTLDDKIDQEVTDRTAAVAAEATARQQADTAQQQALAQETSRAQQAELANAQAIGTNAQALQAEANTRQNADTVLQDHIDDEEERAKAAEATLQSNIDALGQSGGAAVAAERERAQAAESTLDTKIEAETDRAEAAEQTLTDAIAQEVTDRTAAVTAEATARQQADTTLQGNIDAEATARADADTNLQAEVGQRNVTVETTTEPSATDLTYTMRGTQRNHIVGDKRIYTDTNGHRHIYFLEALTGGEAVWHGGVKVYLNKNNGVLTQSMMNAANTIYVIQYGFTLGENITIPENCVLEFDGGSIEGAYTLTGANTKIIANVYPIFPISSSEIQTFNTWKESNYTNTFTFSFNLAGTWDVDKAYPEWFGAVGDGISDDTAPIQKVLNSFKYIYFSKQNYALTQVFVNSNTKIEFIENCYVKAARALIDTEQTNPKVLGESMFCISNADNISIIGNHSIVDMCRSDYPSQEIYESRHCFRIQSAHNINIENISGNNSFGDGFCLAFPSGKNNKGITLRGCISDNNRRQGLSIVDGEYLYIENCVFSNTNGTDPQAGIDIEPNYITGYKIDNINITNCVFKGNAGAGVLIAASLYDDETNRNVNISVTHCISDGDLCGLSLQNYSLFNAFGKITFDDYKVTGRRFAQIGCWGGNSNIRTEINNCSFTKTWVDDTNPSTASSNNVIALESSGVYDHYIGDIYINDFSVENVTNQNPYVIINIRASHTAENTGKVLKNFVVKNCHHGLGQLAFASNIGPIFHTASFEKYDNTSVDFAPIFVMTGFSRYNSLIQSSIKMDNGEYYLPAHSKSVGLRVSFILIEASGSKPFVINDNIIIYNQEHKKLSALQILDPETLQIGGRKNCVGEFIQFEARENGWFICGMSDYMKNKLVQMTEVQ